MDQYQKTRDTLLALNEKTLGLIQQTEGILGDGAATFEQWKQSCHTTAKILDDHVVRIAVVGAIKSGKSTLVNSLLREDRLKRGAGVVTSIVTRIRRGDRLRARLFFKSWDEINAEIEQALVLFPNSDWHSEHEHFDIRRSSDRINLSEALLSLDADMHLAQDGLNANSVLLSSYLGGFDDVEDLVGADATTRDFDNGRFGDHRDYVGEDRRAVYLKDIQLEITDDILDANLEIADCQGSDSPNPLHMAMVQDYLLKAHLIVYVISSRTGLRQADMRFLSIIRQMGIDDNILFVCNFDINEHDGFEDLAALVKKTDEELAVIIQDCRLYAFSALLHLFGACRERLSDKDRNRLEQWNTATKMAAYSESELNRFTRMLEDKLTRERSALLLQNQLEHVAMVLTSLKNWVRLNCSLLKRDAGEAQKLADRIENHQTSMRQVQSMIRGTLDGGVRTISKELMNKIDGFFDPHGGPLLENVIAFIRNYNADLNRYGEYAVSAGFTQALYRVYQDFKQALNTYMAEKINPDIVGFIGRLESRAVEYFESAVKPYEAMVSDTVAQFETSFAQVDFEQVAGHRRIDTLADLEGIKQSMNIEMPPAAATMRYSAHMKTDAVLHLGFYSLLRLVRKALKKPDRKKGAEEIKALRDGIRRMKRETERSVYAHFKDYRENIKFQYMVRLMNEASARLFESLTEHFSVYVADLKALVDSVGTERLDKEQIEKALLAVDGSIDLLKQQLDDQRREIELLRGDSTAPQMAGGTGGG